MDGLEEIANRFLPAVAECLRHPIGVITAHEGLEASGHFSLADSLQQTYAHFTDVIGGRQRIGADRVDETAHTLREIIGLYRRADGQV
ncbi:hypothetical protein [Actinokineospora sp. UTMC 2448]|uniref:hypothetical protein n=1 Tax=Actinokineospora sp. UTMC 2448 TaxID=2268449 RepID=UPI0021643F70|nr:hypothetical protein [Actinokineospora sp. UTMC 2448]